MPIAMDQWCPAGGEASSGPTLGNAWGYHHRSRGSVGLTVPQSDPGVSSPIIMTEPTEPAFPISILIITAEHSVGQQYETVSICRPELRPAHLQAHRAPAREF